jgi:hypothetical protein
VEGNEAHHSAFLVGKVLDVIPCAATPENNEGEKDRYLIRFSEFALVNVPEYWEGDRNPVVYRSFADLGMDPSTLKWESMPEPANAAGDHGGAHSIQSGAVHPLTMAEAKKGLALTFNVAPESIEITIRG